MFYLTDEGVHSSVLMPLDDGTYVEYARGDWAYAALDQHDLFHTLRALFFSPLGALGRRFVKLDRGATPISPQLRGIKLNCIVVDLAKVQSEENRLAALFAAGKSKVENPENHFVFTMIDGGYGFTNNCNTLTKCTLRELGCNVISRSPFAMYDVQQ